MIKKKNRKHKTQDSYDLEWMDEEECNQVLEDNFLDPYDYDFDDLD